MVYYSLQLVIQQKNSDYYRKDFFHNSEIHEVSIEKEEFNSLITNDKNVLPIHFFTIDSINDLLTNEGLNIFEIQSFHAIFKYNLIDKFIHRDRLINSCKYLKRKFGRDIFIASKRK